MSIPTAVFLDTTVLDGQNYNFTSTALTTFVAACKNRKLKLLLPDPTEREISRHMKDRSDGALAALEKARRLAPFLAKLANFPKGDIHKLEMARLTHTEWHTFLRQFEVVKLGYDGVKLLTVMQWYDTGAAPFGKGEKRKEFPDAFAVAILQAYAAQNDTYVAVVSADADLKTACNRFPSLMYFQSLPALTERLLAEDDARIATFRAALDAGVDKIVEAVLESPDVSFYVGRFDIQLEIEDSDWSGFEIVDMRIVAVGEHECTIAFDAVLEAKHYFRWYEHGPEGDGGFVRDRETDRYDVSGTAKVCFDPHTTTVTAVPFAALNEEELEVTVLPYQIRRRW